MKHQFEDEDYEEGSLAGIMFDQWTRMHSFVREWWIIITFTKTIVTIGCHHQLDGRLQKKLKRWNCLNTSETQKPMINIKLGLQYDKLCVTLL